MTIEISVARGQVGVTGPLRGGRSLSRGLLCAGILALGALVFASLPAEAQTEGAPAGGIEAQAPAESAPAESAPAEAAPAEGAQPAAPAVPPAAAEPYNEGLDFATEGRFQEAKARFEAAIAAAPDFALAHFNLALVLKNLGDLAGSRASFERVQSLDPENRQVPMLLADVLSGLQDFPAAAAALRRAIAFDSSDVGLYYRLAYAVEKTATDPERIPLAISAWQEALRRGPQDSAAFGAASAVARFSLQVNRPEDALTAYDHALRLRPDHVDSYFNKAVVLTKLNRHRDAVPVLQKAISLKSPNGPANYLLASIYYKQLKDDEKAVACFEEAAKDTEFAKKDEAVKSAAAIRDYLEKKKAQEASQGGN